MNCSDPVEEYHSCPWLVVMAGQDPDEEYCQCCSDCEGECADEV